METPPPRRDEQSLGEWLMEPQTMIALSAVLIGVCGLFVSLYEASLMRQEQRAAVWPRVSIGFTVNDTLATFRVRNAGVGPARVQAASIRYNDSTVVNWSRLLSQATEGPLSVSQNVKLLNGSVLSPNDQSDIAILDFRDEAQARELAVSVLRGTVDVRACYCSVYDECWTTSLQDGLPRDRRLGMNLSPDSARSDPEERSSQLTKIPTPEPVPSCEGIGQSAM